MMKCDSAQRSKSKLSVGYSQIDNKENHQVQLKSNKYSYSGLHKQKQQSPIKEENRIDDKKKLSVIFKFYASFGDRTNIDYLKSNKVHKIIADACLRQSIDPKTLDILYIKANKNKPNMDFENFITLLETIADLIYSEEPFQQLMDNHLNQLYENIINSTDLGEEEIQFQQEIDIYCQRLIQYLQYPLQIIYNKYFPPHFKSFQIKESQEDFKIKQQNKSQLFAFLKEFEICPQLLTKGTAYMLYDHIIADNNLPQISDLQSKQKFTYNQFSCYIIKLSNLAFKDEEDQTAYKGLQKLAFLLERMELSQGFLNLDTSAVQIKQMKLKASEEILELIISDPKSFTNLLSSTSQRFKIHRLQDEILDESCQNIRRVNTTVSRQGRQSVQSTVQFSKQYEEYCQALFNVHNQELYNIYKQYAGVNQQTGIENEMVGSRWLKLLRDANLVNSNIEGRSSIKIPHNEVDIIFSRACQNTTRGSVTRKSVLRQSMGYNQFLKALQIIGKDQKTLLMILEQNILKLMNKNGENKNRDLLGVLMTILKDREVVEFLGMLHKAIVPYYKHYSNQKGLINFESMLKFYKDFSLFPDLLTKNKVIGIFQMLAKLFEQNQNTKNGCIDQHMFVESLALAAFDIDYSEDISSIEKVFLLSLLDLLLSGENELIRRAENSLEGDGINYVIFFQYHIRCPTGQDWDILYTIRRRFQWLFQQK